MWPKYLLHLFRQRFSQRIAPAIRDEYAQVSTPTSAKPPFSRFDTGLMMNRGESV